MLSFSFSAFLLFVYYSLLVSNILGSESCTTKGLLCFSLLLLCVRKINYKLIKLLWRIRIRQYNDTGSYYLWRFGNRHYMFTAKCPCDVHAVARGSHGHYMQNDMG